MENTVAHVATWVIAGLREKQFTTLAELRAAIRERVAAYNREPFQKRAGSRASVFEGEERALLRPLPAVAYEISRWIYGRRVARNGHVSFERNFYSVPYTQVGAKVDLRITDTMLEVFAGTERLASHLLPGPGVVNEYRTNDADLPAGPGYRQWDPDRVRQWAQRIGSSAVIVVDRIFESVPVAEQGLDPALAVLRLSRRYSAQRVEKACQIALASPIRSPRYAHLRPILETGQDKLPATGRAPGTDPAPEAGGYVRGASYYSAGDAR